MRWVKLRWGGDDWRECWEKQNYSMFVWLQCPINETLFFRDKRMRWGPFIYETFLKLLFYERCKMTKELIFFCLLPRLCAQSRFVLLLWMYCTIRTYRIIKDVNMYEEQLNTSFSKYCFHQVERLKHCWWRKNFICFVGAKGEMNEWITVMYYVLNIPSNTHAQAAYI